MKEITDEKVREYAQYLADRIDVTILLEHVHGLSRDEADKKAGPFLRDEGWQGRKYPLDYFTIATVFESASPHLEKET